jgi:hypothetical protein
MASQKQGGNEPSRRPSRRHWWSAGGAVIGVAVLAWAFARVDYGRMEQLLAQADPAPLAVVPLAIAAEQLVRAWKWRQLLHAIRPIGTLRLFGSIMAGYFANFLIPLGVSPIVRAWLVARLESLKMSTVLATVAIDRLVDGVIFTGFVAAALAFAAFADPAGEIRLGLVIGGAGSLAIFAAALLALARYKRRAGGAGGRMMGWLDRLPARFAGPAKSFARSFAEGIVWPAEPWRGIGIVLASIVIKLIAVTHFLWAGLAFAVVLGPADYVFLVVFLGFLIVLTRFVRIPGGFIIGGVFALDLLGVPKEQALAMVLTVQFSSIAVVGGIGALALWRSGIALDQFRLAKGE